MKYYILFEKFNIAANYRRRDYIDFAIAGNWIYHELKGISAWAGSISVIKPYSNEKNHNRFYRAYTVHRNYWDRVIKNDYIEINDLDQFNLLEKLYS